MTFALPILKVLLLFTLSGLSLFRLAPRAIGEIHSWVDRVLLSFLTGTAFYTVFFLLAQGLFGLPISGRSVWGVFVGIILVGSVGEFYRRRKHLPTAFEDMSGSPLTPRLTATGAAPLPRRGRGKRDILIMMGLALIFFFALNTRLQNGLRHPDKLLDADPYRHHIRTAAVIESGHLSKYDPYLIGEVPIFELQGCYVLAGVLGVAGPFSAWILWLWGAQVFGALGVISVYLLTKLSLKRILERDLGPPPETGGKKKREKNPSFNLWPESDTVAAFLGLASAALLAASPVHILRTNAGFSEAYAVPLLAPTLLFYLWAAQSRVWGDFVWFGVFFTALALINPVPAVFIVPFFMLHGAYTWWHGKGYRWPLGILLSAGIFFASVAVWNWMFLATPLLTGLQATGHAGTEGMLRRFATDLPFWKRLGDMLPQFTGEIFRNLDFFNPGGRISSVLFGLFGLFTTKQKLLYDLVTLGSAGAGAVWILFDRSRKRWSFDVTSAFFFLSFFSYFLVLFLIPFGFISFTSKYYRYILPISLSLSYLFVYFYWRLILRFFPRPRTRKRALAAALLLSLIIAAEGKTWGGWVLNCTPEEYAAADWINRHTPPDSILIANWYTGDYLRSLTRRPILFSDYARVEVREAMKRSHLKIPILPRSPQAVLDFVNRHPGSYYLVTAKWGPWGDYANFSQFKLLAEFGNKEKTKAKIYRVERTAPPLPETNKE